MGNYIEKQVEQLIIQKRDKEVTKKMREAFEQKNKQKENHKNKKWYKFW